MQQNFAMTGTARAGQNFRQFQLPIAVHTGDGIDFAGPQTQANPVQDLPSL